MIKKIFIFFICNLILLSQVGANNIDNFTQKLFQNNQDKNIFDQAEIYNKYLNQLQKVIIKNEKTIFLTQIIELKNNISEKYDEIIQEILKNKAKINSGNTLILNFSNQTNFVNYINKNKQKILDSNSVFIFRSGENILSSNMKKITSQIKNISPKILIFTDQEGGKINRFVSFEQGFSIRDYNDNIYVYYRYKQLNQDDKNILENLFAHSQYFPSLANIGKSYTKISSNNKRNFLEIITFIQLKNLQEHGINTHGFIADLDLGNPVISGLNRSFSDNVLDYFSLIDAYIQASKQTGVILYAKHFPGHGSGKIDSHADILDYSDNTDYVESNMLIFEYFLQNTQLLGKGIMVGHMYLDKNISQKFHKILNQADFIITDDLAMQGYKKITNIPEGKIFSTKEILNKNNLIKINTQDNIGIK